MKIDTSSIAMSSSSLLTQSYEKKESLKLWIGGNRPNSEGTGAPQTLKDLLPQLSDNARKMMKSHKAPATGYDQLSDREKMILMLAEALYERVTGKKVRFRIIGMPDQGSDTAGSPNQGWEIEYNQVESYAEKESLTVKASGLVKTSDGRTMNFDLSLSLGREFTASQSIGVQAGNAQTVDPLMINFGGRSPSVTDKKYSFDLNADGVPDTISFAAEGSGFLALDKNKNGVIDNGSELFGTATGNGFAELAGKDGNHDGWIDEADPVFNDIKIWTKDDNGKDSLSSLKDKNIGAIYLGNIPAQFSFRDASNVKQADTNSAGIYLKEDGSAGFVQHVNLAV